MEFAWSVMKSIVDRQPIVVYWIILKIQTIKQLFVESLKKVFTPVDVTHEVERQIGGLISDLLIQI